LEVERENAVLRDEINHLSLQVSSTNTLLPIVADVQEYQFKSPSSEYISESVHYKILLDHASKLENTVKESLERGNQLRMENEKLLSGRKEYEESLNVSFIDDFIGTSSRVWYLRSLQRKQLRNSRAYWRSEMWKTYDFVISGNSKPLN
jgi:hypothetical protein